MIVSHRVTHFKSKSNPIKGIEELKTKNVDGIDIIDISLNTKTKLSENKGIHKMMFYFYLARKEGC
jgi:hypothetical protein